MEYEKQIKFQKFVGMVKMIAEKTGYNQKFVGRVLNGTVNTNTPGGRKIKKLAMELAQRIESISLDDE